MRNTSKMTTLENRFPLLAVEHGCIISKDADITVAFEVELPELYTVTGAEYEAIHSCWCKAIKVLPDYSVVHKQDWFIKERYKPELQKDDMSFLSRSFERHFNERPYLKHTCYLYLTKTTKERNRMQSNFSTLCRGHIIPKELDRETTTKFLEACEQFERIMNDSGLVRLRRLSTDEIVGTEGKTGLIERYFSLMLICLVKGTAAGFLAGLTYEALAKKSRLAGVITAGIVCPVVNTGLFILGMLLCFYDVLSSWASGASLIYYLIFGLTGVNFLIELAVNLILSSTLVRIIKVGEKR